MEITTSISVPYYVYTFYQKIAQQLGNTTTEAVMADALFEYAGTLAESMLSTDFTTWFKQNRPANCRSVFIISG